MNENECREFESGTSKFSGKPINVLVLFFSGTGNTQYVGEYIARRVLQLADGDCTVTLAALEWCQPAEVTKYNLVCLGYPIYEGRAPRNVKEFLQRIPKVRQRGAFVFNTKGMAQGSANRNTVRTLCRRGFVPLGTASVVMPGSDAISLFLKKDSPKMLEYLSRDFSHIEAADTFAAHIAAYISKLRHGAHINSMPRDRAGTLSGHLVTGIFSALYSIIDTTMKKKFRITESCNSCGICVRQCPAQNITLDDSGIAFGDRCILCLRCINNCPKEAVQVGSLSVGKGRWHGPGGNYRPLRYQNPRMLG